MRKLIIIRSKAEGLGELYKKGAEAALTELPSSDQTRKRKVILINPEGSSDTNEKTVSQVLSASDLGELEKPNKKKRHLKQLFTKAIAAGADIVIIDNGNEIVVSEEECISDGKTFEYEAIQFVSIEEILPGQNGDEKEQKKRKSLWK